MAPARTEVKIRLQSDPVLEKHLARLEAQNAEQHKQIESLQAELDKCRKEDLDAVQAARRHESDETSRRLEQYREAGLQLQTQLEACRLQISSAAALIAQKDTQANELATKLAESRDNQTEMMGHAEAHYAILQARFENQSHELASRWQEECGHLHAAQAQMEQHVRLALDDETFARAEV